MLKLTAEQTREEIRMIESHIGKLGDLDIVEIQKGQLGRLVYFAKKGLINIPHRRTQAINSNLHDSGPPSSQNDYAPAE